MKLKPVIASYSGETVSNIIKYLDDDVLSVIAGITDSPQNVKEITGNVLAELIEMHVLKEQAGVVKLDTAVFLGKDIEHIREKVIPIAKELGQCVLQSGSAFKNAPPEITIFLGGVIGLVQGLGRTEGKHNGVAWKNYTGKYARTKVDFDELCDAYDTIGQDFLNKSVIQGERYTAVFIGPIEKNFEAFAFPVDACAMLATGEIQDESLLRQAESANMYWQGKWRTVVVTNKVFRKYEKSIESIRVAASSLYSRKMVILESLLHSTTAGRQGVPSENMMLNLWRYVRKLTAGELYKNRFFKDDIPTMGMLTVFYENDVDMIRQLLI